MTLTETNHRCLERLALAIAVLNLASVRILFANEWSFYFDPWFLLCIVLPAFVIALPLLPFLIPSSGSSSTSKSEVVWLVFTFAAMIGFELIWCAKIAFTIFCRDRFGTFYWPWEQREFKLQVLDSWNLSARMWTDIFQQSIPVQPLVREVPGLALVIIHVLLIPFIAATLLPRYNPRVTFIRTFSFAIIFQVLSGCVGKMALQCLFNLNYIVHFPEWFFNL